MNTTDRSALWRASYESGVPAEIDPDRYSSVMALLDEAAENYPDNVALECFGATITYRELIEKSTAIAAYLQQKLGVKKGDRVALMSPNIFAFPLAMFGVIRAGGAQVNVNPLYTPRELAHQLTDAGVDTIIIYGASIPTLAAALADTPIKNVITMGAGDGSTLPVPAPEIAEGLPNPVALTDVLEEGAKLALEPVALTGEDTIFFQYTGGTTGPSKGAVLTHRNLVANSEQFRAFLPGAAEQGKEVVIGATPMYHIMGLTLSLCYLAIGAKLVLIPDPRNLDMFVGQLKDSKFSIIAGVNTLFQGLTMHPQFKEVDFSNYKVAVGGGTAVIEATSEAWKAITGKHIKEGYGLSETSPILCTNPMSNEHFTGSCGLPVPSTEIKLLNDQDEEAALGEPGEICARGPQVMQGYWNKPEANKTAFTEDGFFRTGDIGVFDDKGYLRIVDRKKDMILVSGFNVFPNEIEAVVVACEGVAECACIGVPDEKSGEAVRVFVLLKPGAALSDDDLIRYCRENLAGYKVPKQVRFVEELPKSNVGKILRRELRELT